MIENNTRRKKLRLYLSEITGFPYASLIAMVVGILAVYGNITFGWKNYSSKKNDSECHLETGEIFKP